jgi:hypothetical protein
MIGRETKRRADRLLNVFRQFEPYPVSFPELQAETGYAKTTLQRVLAFMVRSGTIERIRPGGLGRGNCATYGFRKEPPKSLSL